MTKSLARVKFFGTIGIGWLAALGINFIGNEDVANYLLIVFFVCAIYSMLVKCEKCGVYMYRYNSKHHGLPHPKCFSLVKKCPSCGVDRV
tara:strand:- start:17103 stop:17372 length:270 start_codon:yes stop_codon:yes gene_type:complete